METLKIVVAQISDVQILSQMNKELIEDEKSENPMTVDELTTRMKDFLNNGWKAVLLVLGDQNIGYALYQERVDTNIRSRAVYLRQYFICRQYRGRGFGKQGIDLLRYEIFQDATVSIDVLESNPGGKKFWEGIGFKAYYTNMKLNP
jgi:predicted acetyltransferase